MGIGVDGPQARHFLGDRRAAEPVGIVLRRGRLSDPTANGVRAPLDGRSLDRQTPVVEPEGHVRAPDEVLADPGLIVDNIQTRMVAGVADATAEVDATTLEQAKQNLEQGFAAFGISERFDESAVLIAWALGVRTVPAVARRRRVTGMGEAAAPDSLRDTFVRRNAVDLELYAWAAELFDRRVDEAGAALQVEVARHRIARLNALFEEAQAAMAELHEQFVRLEAPGGGEAPANAT